MKARLSPDLRVLWKAVYGRIAFNLQTGSTGTGARTYGAQLSPLSETRKRVCPLRRNRRYRPSCYRRRGSGFSSLVYSRLPFRGIGNRGRRPNRTSVGPAKPARRSRDPPGDGPVWRRNNGRPAPESEYGLVSGNGYNGGRCSGGPPSSGSYPSPARIVLSSDLASWQCPRQPVGGTGSTKRPDHGGGAP